MNKFREWYLTNSVEITWFLIGLLVSSGIDLLTRGHYVNAAISFAIAYVNYLLRNK